MKRKRQEYALYRGDEFIDVGTIQEIAQRQNVTPQTIHYYKSPAYKRKFKDDKNRKVLVKIERDY